VGPAFGSVPVAFWACNACDARSTLANVTIGSSGGGNTDMDAFCNELAFNSLSLAPSFTTSSAASCFGLPADGSAGGG
jgi:hypothetical protein